MKIEEILENKKVVEKIVKVIPVFDKNKDYLAFPIEILPSSFKKLNFKKKKFIRQVIKGMEIPNVGEFFNKKIKIEIINFRNMDAIKFVISDNKVEEKANILIPHIKERSPVLDY